MEPKKYNYYDPTFFNDRQTDGPLHNNDSGVDWPGTELDTPSTLAVGTLENCDGVWVQHGEGLQVAPTWTNLIDSEILLAELDKLQQYQNGTKNNKLKPRQGQLLAKQVFKLVKYLADPGQYREQITMAQETGAPLIDLIENKFK